MQLPTIIKGNGRSKVCARCIDSELEENNLKALNAYFYGKFVYICICIYMCVYLFVC